LAGGAEAGRHNPPVAAILRHWFASSLLRAGADLKAVLGLMGHSSPNLTLSTYYHLVEGRKLAAPGYLQIPSLDKPIDKPKADSPL